ncbi:21708_t:CDS:2 [Rhizophagus irregularis]|nr:21708_t:CDS:2 [Rhizophagus irregularis]
MAQKNPLFFKQCKDYISHLKKLKPKKCDSEENKPEEAFVDKPLKELETKKCDSEENKPKDKSLKELERQDETEKFNSKEEFADNELKNITLKFNFDVKIVIIHIVNAGQLIEAQMDIA